MIEKNHWANRAGMLFRYKSLNAVNILLPCFVPLQKKNSKWFDLQVGVLNIDLNLHHNFNNLIMLANYLANNVCAYLFGAANQIIIRVKHDDMRLISCVALLMVIPAIGLLTNSNKFIHKKMPATPVHRQLTNDSIKLNWFDRDDEVAKFNGMPFVFSTDHRLSLFKPAHPDPGQSFSISR
ncbi:hypothetical protein [Pedobacter terrae]|uniref:hypothetical protein n=1 Tax=Pedobacter terrae TaxID=405671 RepID=UPI002FF8E8DA